jgi:hypothetical protein
MVFVDAFRFDSVDFDAALELWQRAHPVFRPALAAGGEHDSVTDDMPNGTSMPTGW